jgi:ectoine hydroxylase-related dioxygenase (phytanoyl-CoA dioxygenase family)
MNQQEQQLYQDNGYLIVRQLIEASDLDRLRQELADMQAQVESGRWRGNHLMEDNGVARVIFNPYDHSPTLRDLVGRSDVIDRVKTMLSGAVALDHSKLMCKAAYTGTPQPPHQDYFYWQGSKANQVACFVCIDPSNEANGCLRVCPGTQRLGLLEHKQEHHAITDERHWVCQMTEEMVRNEEKFIGQPDDAIFFGSLTIHRSDGNTSPRPRRGVIFEYDQKDNLDRRPGWGAPIPPVDWE